MSVSDHSKVIPFSSRRHTKSSDGLGVIPEINPKNTESAFYYTLELLLEDFGKKHCPKSCALCEPMKVLGLHRDEVMVRLCERLFTLFFPSFKDYLRDLKSQIMEGLLKKTPEAQNGTLQARMKTMVLAQIYEDIGDFLGDICKHLKKYANVEIDGQRKVKIQKTTYQRIQKEWMKL